MTPHVEKDFPFGIVSFALLALRRLVDDYELGDFSVSSFTVQLRFAFIHFRIFFFCTEAVLLRARFCEVLVEWNQHIFLMEIDSFFGLGQATCHTMPRHLLELQVHAVRLLVFRPTTLAIRSAGTSPE